MAKVFLSYSRADQEVAAEVAAQLSDQGHDVFTDMLLPAGQEWQQALAEGLRSSDVVVSIISPDSTNSQFVMTELGAAMAYARESGKMLVLPVIIGHADIPTPVREINAIIDRDADPSRIANEIGRAIAHFIGSRTAAQEKQEETRQRIEKNAADYVGEAVASQKLAEARYRRLGMVWYAAGLVALVAGLVFVALALIHVQPPAGDWTTFALMALRAVIVIVLLGACAKYAFALGRSFTVESLKSADRLHAISFGEFYLRVYGQEAEWQDLKEAFANWNIDRPSAFVDTRSSDFDPKLVELITNIVQAVTGNKKP